MARSAAPDGDLPMARRAQVALSDWMRSAYRRAHYAARAGATGTRPSATDLRRDPPAPACLGIPGIWETWEFLEPWGRRLFDDGWDVHLLPSLADMSDSVASLAAAVSGHIAAGGLHDVVLFAHSKGGLVGKTVMTGPEGWRVRGMVAFATPWDGVPIASVVPGSATEELEPGSAVVRRLAGSRSVNSRIISVEAQWDQNVPSVELPGARRVTLPLLGHSGMLDSPVAADVLVRLTREFGVPETGVPEEVDRS